MNKLKFLVIAFILGSITTFISCEDDDKGSLFKHSSYKLTFDNYDQLPSNSFPNVNKFFTPANAAKNYIPGWLNERYYSIADGSTAEIIYKFKDYDRPEYLEKLNRELRTLDLGDYQIVWGDIYASFFTPDIPATKIAEILNQKEEAEAGDFRIVFYNYSSESAIIKNDQKIYYFREDFNGITGGDFSQFEYKGWYNQDLSGVGYKWRVRVNGATDRIAMAYSRDSKGSSSWLINTEPIDLRYALNPTLKFGYGLGYLDQSQPTESFDCMTMYLTNKFDGKNPSSSSWQDVSTEAGLRDLTPATGYPGRPTQSLNLTNHVGDYLHMGFHYYLPTRNNAYSLAPLYYLDNIEISEIRDIAEVTSTEGKYSIFIYDGSTWNMVDDTYYALQPEDYNELNVGFLTTLEAAEKLPAFLNQKFADSASQEKKIVVYKISETNMGASEFIFDGSNWIEAGGEIADKTDKYIYRSNTGWGYEEN